MLPITTTHAHMDIARPGGPDSLTWPVVVAFVREVKGKCVAHGDHCPTGWRCPTRVFNGAVRLATGDDHTHCETYFPLTRISFTVDIATGKVYFNHDRQFMTEHFVWEFYLLMLTKTEHDAAYDHLVSRLGAKYDSYAPLSYTFFSIFGSCTPPMTIVPSDDTHAPFASTATTIHIERDPAEVKETCARLVTEALVMARLIPQDTDLRMATPKGVIMHLQAIGARLLHRLPRIDHVDYAPRTQLDRRHYVPQSSMFSEIPLAPPSQDSHFHAPRRVEFQPTASYTVRMVASPHS